jgi:hypothetical protein
MGANQLMRCEIYFITPRSPSARERELCAECDAV